ncbi:hypothetical protein ACRS3X_06165 [Ectopseudomonas hydrolytica]|uniref:hypothetical protein n=1 Tax=Ectopseudomonas hydrolytica TaxID=2493633 RepID=UPI003EE01F20
MQNAHPTQSDWVDGAAAWDLLHQDPIRQTEIGTLMKEANNWLSSPDKLNAGDKLINESLHKVLGGVATSAPEVGRLLQRGIYGL